MFFGPLHVLFVYAFKRFTSTVERDEAVFEEIQRRADQVPPGQRQAAIDAMKRDRDQITAEVYAQKNQEKAFSDAFNFVFWCAFWVIALIVIYFVWGHDLYLWWWCPNCNG